MRINTKMRIKVVFFISDLNYGGAQRQLITLVKSINKEKFDVSVIYYYVDCPLEKDLQEADVTTICIEKKGWKDFFGFYLKLVIQLRKIQPDIIHSYLMIANLFALAIKPFFPFTKIVWGIRDSTHLVWGIDNEENIDIENNDQKDSLIFQTICFFSRFTDMIIANSYAGKKYFLAHNFPQDKTITITNGINTERFTIDPEARNNIRTEWGINPDTILIGLVGRIHPMKDHPTFLQAAAILSQNKKNIKFICVGSGEENYQQELQQLAKKLGLEAGLIWAGSRQDMPAVYNALDIAVSASSRGEGFSNVLGESMACGVSCVATDVGDSAIIIGDDGMVVSPGDFKALAIAIEQVIEKDDYHKYLHKKHLREKVVNNFSVAQLAQKTEQALLDLMK